MAKKVERKWRIVGIKPPGRVDIYPFGEICLSDLDDATLEKIKIETGCEYIQPVPPEPTKDIKANLTPKND